MKNSNSRVRSSTLRLWISLLIVIFLYSSKSQGLICHCSDCYESQYHCETENDCYSSITFDGKTGKVKHAVGCKDVVFPSRETPISCNETSPTSAFACCSDTDYCNQCIKLPPLGGKFDVSFIESPESYEQELCFDNGTWNFQPQKSPNKLASYDNGTVTIILVLCTLIIITIILCLYFLKWLNCCQANRSSSGTRILQEPQSLLQESQNLPQETTSGEIKIIKSIAEGGFSKVSAGLWENKLVAIKIFMLKNQEHWQREVENYKTINHENILKFMGRHKTADELYIFTEYHPSGSLYDYLQKPTIDTNHMLEMVMSIALGLEYLHKEIVAQDKSKPAMAHRDIKSKNVLVKLDGKCVIADLGQAVLYDPVKKSVNAKAGETFGTVRYLSPEVLKNQIINTINGYQSADVYALALTMWEVAGCCSVGDIKGVYQQPFSSVSPNPTIEQMHLAVCFQKQRPKIPEKWENEKVLNFMASLIKKCWVENPNERPIVKSVIEDLQTMIKEELSIK